MLSRPKNHLATIINYCATVFVKVCYRIARFLSEQMIFL